MGLALRALPISADYLLVDYLNLPEEAAPQDHVTKGDRYVLSIAAASIVAKVYRDRLMARLEEVFPGYDLAHNKGYGTRAHRTALAALGPCAIHRLSFAPCAAWLARRRPAGEAPAGENKGADDDGGLGDE
jgi:ribonuclease HII